MTLKCLLNIFYLNILSEYNLGMLKRLLFNVIIEFYTMTKVMKS